MRLVRKAFALRPAPDPTAVFRGTYREEAWRRVKEQADREGIPFTLWRREDFPIWSLPALEAARCVARQGEELFEAVHLALFRAFFAEGRNVGEKKEVIEVVETIPGLDHDRFLHDYEGGVVREDVLEECDEAMQRYHVEAVPTVIINETRRIIGAHPIEEYLKVLKSFGVE